MRGKNLLNNKRLYFIMEHILGWSVFLILSVIIFTLGASLFYGFFTDEYKVQGLEKIGSAVKEIHEAVVSSNISNSSNPINRATLTFSVARIIFINNAKLNTLFSIPFLGLGFYTYTLLSTGAIGRYISELIADDKWFSFMLATIYSVPHTYLEFLAYSITTFESLLITVKILRRRMHLSDIATYLGSLGLSYIILFLAAILEIELII